MAFNRQAAALSVPGDGPMSEDLRKSGLDIVGDVPWGTHFCQFYRTAGDLLDILVPYFAQGLRHNEFCMWVTSEPLGVEAARAALAAALPDLDAYLEKGQIEILPHSAWYLRGGTFEADRVLAAWVAKLEAARAAGFEGLRLTGNTFWLEPKDWGVFTDYEAQIDGVIGKYRMLAVCTYSLDRCGSSEILDVIRNHRFALIRREGKWELVESSERRRAEEALQASREELRQQNEELLRVQHELQKSEELFRIVASSTPDHVLVQDSDLRYTLVVNPQMGLTEKDMIGKTDGDLLSPREAENLAAIKKSVLVMGKPVHVEMPVSSPGGDREYFEGSYVPRFDAQGKPNGLIGYFRNVTERKRSEEALRQLAQFPEQNPNPVLRVARDGALMYANPPARDLVAALGGPDGSLAPRELREKMREAAARSGVVESDLEDGRGRTFWLAAMRPSGERYVNVYARDITLRKQAERRSELGALLLARVHDAVIGADPDMRITYWNRSAELMFGFTEAEAVGRETLALLQPAYGPGERERVLEELERQGASEAVIRLKHKDGRVIVVEAHATRLAEAERTTGYAVVYRDITERLEAEKALQESHEELEVSAEELRQQNEELLRIQSILHESKEEQRHLAEQRQVALDAALMGWWRYDPVTRMAKWDDRCKQIFGVEGHERLSDEIVAQIVHPEDREGLLAKVEAALDPDHPQPFAAEYRIIRPDGETRWVEAHGRAGFETSGGRRHAVSFVGTVADITGRRRAEEALRESERLERERAEQLKTVNEELMRFNRVMVGRETRMVELKKEVNELAERLGERRRYRISSEEPE
jgi:PAS domain S-box-containing protein